MNSHKMYLLNRLIKKLESSESLTIKDLLEVNKKWIMVVGGMDCIH